MRVVNAGFEIWDNEENVLKKIEKVARVCYKSEHNIKEGSAERMVKTLIKHKHYAMLEHGSLIVQLGRSEYTHIVRNLEKIRAVAGELPYLRYTPDTYSGRYIISGNMRAWREYFELCMDLSLSIGAGLYEILNTDEYNLFKSDVDLKIEIVNTTCWAYKKLSVKDLTPKEALVHGDLTGKFIVDRGVSHEIVRHRKASFAQESTRYCNYKNAGDVVFIRPCFFNGLDLSSIDAYEEDYMRPLTGKAGQFKHWINNCRQSEKDYLGMIKDGATPQEARDVLNTSVKTELVMTANLGEWRHFLKLRAVGTTGAPHPQMQEVAIPLLKELKKRDPIVFGDLAVIK